jgi:thiol-disulfide isomerase/thioredoxin
MYELSEITIDSFIKNNKFSLIEFYSSNCPTCKQVEVLLERLSTYCINESIDLRIGKIDADYYSNIAASKKITKYSEVRLYSSEQEECLAIFLNSKTLTEDVKAKLESLLNE